MKPSKTIEGTTRVWLSHTNYTLRDLLAMDPDRAVSLINYYHADMESAGWVEIGKAKISVTLFSEEEVTGKQIDALRNEIQEIRAEAQQKVQYIEDRIQSLLALPNPNKDGNETQEP